MDKFKNFIKGKKIEKHFKRSGPGVKLSETSNAPSIVAGSAQGGSVDRVAASDVAAQAALKRLYKDEKPQISSSQKKIQMLAQRELEEERRKNDPESAMKSMRLEPKRETDVREFEHSDALTGVYYTCELLGDDVSMEKHELISAIEEFLLEQLVDGSDDLTIPAILLVHSVNKPAVKSPAIETIAKYIQNIIENPSDPKYRRIRLSNKAFQERVLPAKGAREFLSAVGFKEEQQSMKDGDPLEAFLVMGAEHAENTGILITAREALLEGHSIPIKVARNASIYLLKENERVSVPKVSADFFDLTAEEVKKEQQMKTDEVNRLLSLRTKEMRDRDERLRQYKYKYSLIRIRLPDRYVIQGTFGCYEPLSAVRSFLHTYLDEAVQPMVWTLKDPMRTSQELDENRTLGELGLAPAAVLHVEFLDSVGGLTLAEKYRETALPFAT